MKFYRKEQNVKHRSRLICQSCYAREVLYIERTHHILGMSFKTRYMLCNECGAGYML